MRRRLESVITKYLSLHVNSSSHVCTLTLGAREAAGCALLTIAVRQQQGGSREAAGSREQGGTTNTSLLIKTELDSVNNPGTGGYLTAGPGAAAGY